MRLFPFPPFIIHFLYENCPQDVIAENDTFVANMLLGGQFLAGKKCPYIHIIFLAWIRPLWLFEKGNENIEITTC